MKRSLSPSVLILLASGAFACGSGATAPAGDDDTGTPTGDTGTTPTDGGGSDTSTPPTDGGGTDTSTPPTDGGGTDTSVPPTDGGTTCAKAAGTEGVHLMLNVTWKGTLAINAGSGVAHLWTKSVFTTDAAGKRTAQQTPCGSMIPDIMTTAIAGSTKIQPEFLPAVWAGTKMPVFTVTGKVSGYNIGDTVAMDPIAVIVGTTLADPGGAWPSPGALTGVDHDGDGHLGISATPKTGGGYSQPPVDLSMGSRADLLYIASRTTSAISGKRTTCDMATGTATVTTFDNHVIGCHIAGGAECTAAQQKFVDDNRTVFAIGTSTFEAKTLADGASCADIRAALPAK